MTTGPRTVKKPTGPGAGTAAGAAQPHRLAQALTDADRERKWPTIRPKGAATLILLDHSAATPKVLMGKRHAGHKFMPGKFVFPGGRIEKSDRYMTCVQPLPAIVAAKLQARRTRPSASRPQALALAAIRETFEETGLLLGRRREQGEPALRAPDGPWTDFLGYGVVPDLSQLQFIARAITPPKRPKRFDTAFFSMDASAIAHRIEGIVTPDSELVELVWTPLPEARELDLPPITLVVLEELEKRLGDGMKAEAPVPFYYEAARKWRREEL